MQFLRNQWSQIRTGGLHTLVRKTGTAVRRLAEGFLFLCHAIWAIPGVLLIRTIRPWIHVRVDTFYSSRIGHFVADASIFLARRSLQQQGEQIVDLFWFPEPTCNQQWSRMVRRQLFVRWWVRYLARFNRLIPGGALHENPMPVVSGSRIVYGVLRQSSARFQFLAKEEEEAKLFLRSRGWHEGEPFVCILVRDSAYLASQKLNTSGDINQWSYHNYRDSNIDSYVEAVNALLQKGYWVIRMSKISNQRLSLTHERFIDYPFIEDQDDLYDVWLSVNCSFFVSTATGIDIVPWVYGRPIVYVNALPLIAGAFPINHIWVPKHLRWKETGNRLTLKEHCSHGYAETKGYLTAQIAIEDLSPAEITAAVMECERRLTGTWMESDEDRSRQQRFWRELRKSPEFCKNNDYIHPEARMGCAWLRSMGDEFFE